MQWKYFNDYFSYFDDILTVSKDEAEHTKHLRLVFKRLQDWSSHKSSKMKIFSIRSKFFTSSYFIESTKERIKVIKNSLNYKGITKLFRNYQFLSSIYTIYAKNQATVIPPSLHPEGRIVCLSSFLTKSWREVKLSDHSNKIPMRSWPNFQRGE